MEGPTLSWGLRNRITLLTLQEHDDDDDNVDTVILFKRHFSNCFRMFVVTNPHVILLYLGSIWRLCLLFVQWHDQVPSSWSHGLSNDEFFRLLNWKALVYNSSSIPLILQSISRSVNPHWSLLPPQSVQFVKIPGLCRCFRFELHAHRKLPQASDCYWPSERNSDTASKFQPFINTSPAESCKEQR